MNIEATEIGVLIVVVSMALVTLATRLGGVYVMSFVPISERVRLFIQGMSGSVLVAILTPLALTGDNAARLALLTTGGMMFLVKKPLPAIAVGIVVAALVRQF